ncbi:right-handed parallel beta-helix repeat-containing protein [Natrarchaeobius oligotrophus]|uniref:J domain-containing protein n=1 Tax=Natrarchaeobius chitinivorans TaxID=1679083 RepID=A0A3N6M8T8_NATCH|nr:right-handed parallel beta-helix repeat-containing protein [Natrarchaeobius chitinivorans]RQH00089.1 hypothetical protein EA472_12840 [Natrarchaeobius chitinivorans]
MTDANGSNTDVSAVDVLGVSPSPSEDEILNAFREQARRFHPDRFDPDDVDIADGDDLNADDLFRDVKRARDELVGDVSGASYTYGWRDGTPVTGRETEDPTERKPGEGTEEDNAGGEAEGGDHPNGRDDGEPGTGTGDGPEETTGGGDGEWNTDDTERGSGIDDTVGVNIGEGSEEEFGGGAEETVTVESGVSRRELLTLGGVISGGVILAHGLGLFDSTTDVGSGDDRTEEHVVVTPDDVLQEAADRVVSGGTLELEPGTYAQRVIFTEDVTVTAPEGATLAGGGADTAAVTLGDADVELEGLTIVEFDDGGIHSGVAGGALTLSDVTVEDVGDVGVDLIGERIEIRNLTVRNTVGTGVSLSVPADGTVTIDGVVAQDNEDSGVGAATDGRGIVVEGGEHVAISDAEVVASGNEGIHVVASETGSQNVEITDTFVADSASRSGICIDGSRDSQTVELADVEAVDNDREGIRIGTEHRIATAVLDGVTVADNDDTGLDARVTDDGVITVSGSVFDRNGGAGTTVREGYGVSVRGGTQVVLEETTVTESRLANLRIEGERVDGQSVELRDLDLFGSTRRSGVRFDGGRSEDSIVVERCRADDNGDYGFDLAGETVRIDETNASGNGDGELHLQDIDREDAEIHDSF